MTTFVRAHEAARLLGVSTSTLYAYVSRGLVSRRTGADGRTSLFALDEIEARAARSRSGSAAPRPTIDVQIASAITTLDEEAVVVRGHDLAELVGRRPFEDVAELLWSGELPAAPVGWPKPARADLDALAIVHALDGVDPVARLAIAAHVLGSLHRDEPPGDAARRLLLVAPPLLGARRAGGPFAVRVASIWRARPSPQLVGAIGTALGLLADHELATSTLAVRVAASVRTSAYGALAAGLATVEGALHGSASALANRFLAECATDGVHAAVERRLTDRQRIPGFGHKVYRGADPRFGPLFEQVRALEGADVGRRVAVVDEALAEVGRRVPHQPNIDLALGALTWVAGLDPHVPLFALARIAGWGAHCAEEFEAPPVRYRGLARRPT